MATRKLVEEVFKVLDVDNDGRLRPEEVKSYSESRGWKGSDDDWSAEWRKLAEEHTWDTSLGPDLEQFITAVLSPEGSCYAEEEKLQALLSNPPSKNEVDPLAQAAQGVAAEVVEPAAKTAPAMDASEETSAFGSTTAAKIAP